MSDPFRRLAALLGDEAQLDAPLAHFTTVGIGGGAALLVVPHRRETVVRLWREVRAMGLSLHLFGGMSNVLLPDEDLRAVVLLNRLRGHRFLGEVVEVESGEMLAPLARRAIRRGLDGLTWAINLPGTVGGALVNNAGAYGGEIGALLESATLLSPDGEVMEVGAEWFEFGYRTSRLKGNGAKWMILAARLRLQRAEREGLEAVMERFIAHRRRTQPRGRTLGSTFKNPPGDYAGRLIDAAGLKGLRRGAIVVSHKHANFFINEGGGTAADFLALMMEVQQRVQERFGLWLEPEIEIIGATNGVAAEVR